MTQLDDDVCIRDFRKSDLPDALNVARLSFTREFELTGFDPDHVSKMVDQMFGVTGRILLNLFKIFGKEPFKLFVAETHKRVIGTTMVNRQGRVAYISTVMVHPDYRRRGIARRLVKSAAEYARRKRMKRAILHVIPANLPAKNLYTSLGFRDFENRVQLIADTESIPVPKEISQINIQRFQKSDTEAVYSLIRSSEDAKHLDAFDFKKGDLKTGLLENVFSFATKHRMVAVHNGSLVGYIETTWTTAEEAGHVANIQVCPTLRGKGIEEMLIHEGANEIKRMGTKKILGSACSSSVELITAMEKLGFSRCLELDGMLLELR